MSTLRSRLMLHVDLEVPPEENIGDIGRTTAAIGFADEARHLGVEPVKPPITSGPVRISGTAWNGRDTKIDYNYDLYQAWGEVVMK